MHRELDPEFAAVSERGFRTPVANIARVTAILERSNDPNMRQALLYTQRAWIQLDQQNPASTIRTPVANIARPLAGGSCHLQGVTCDMPIIGLFQKTCASILIVTFRLLEI
jgi:hypothetical protein